MNKFNVFVVLSIIAATALFGGALITPSLAQANTMSMDNSTMPMDDMGNMTMSTDNSTGMMNNSTMQQVE